MSKAVTEISAGWRQRSFAWLMHRASPRYEALVRDRKRQLLGGLKGTVVEIGAGTGPNLQHYGPGARWIGVEPNPAMHEYLRREAKRLGRDADLRGGRAESLPFADESVDAVVSTLVLCSVDDVRLALQEAQRVLRPGGQFVFLEHVAAAEGSGRRRWQQCCAPCWRWLADGCRLDRELEPLLASGGWRDLRVERFTLPLGLIGPHVAGVAVRAGG